MQLAGLGLALVVGLSPSLAELGRHFAAEPEALYVLACAVVLVLAVRDDRSRGLVEPPAIARSVPWIASATALVLFAFHGGLERFARPALALGAIGWLRASGTRLPTALLAVWAIPVPKAFSVYAGVGWHDGWAALASGVSPRAVEALALDYWDSGLRPAAIASALGWWNGLASGVAPWRPALRLGALGFLSQGAAVAIAVALAAAGSDAAGRAFLSHGAWVLTAAASLLAFAPRTPKPVPHVS